MKTRVFNILIVLGLWMRCGDTTQVSDGATSTTFLSNSTTLSGSTSSRPSGQYESLAGQVSNHSVLSRSSSRTSSLPYATSEASGIHLATTSTSSASNPSHGLGTYILAGLGSTANRQKIVTSSELANVSHTISFNASQSSTSALNVSIAATGSGWAYASRCNDLLLSWSESLVAVQSTITKSTTWTYTTYESDMERKSLSSDAATTTLCDGVAHVFGGDVSYGSLHETTYTTYTVTEAEMIYTTANYSIARPDCTIQSSDCSRLYNAYMTSSEVVFTTTISGTSQTYAPYPACQWQQFATCNNCCTSCTVSAQSVQMMYWPPVPVGGECAANRTYVSASATKAGLPNTRVIGNATYTSPTVYLSFSYVFAPYGHAGNCGDVVSSTIVPMAPEDVSSVRFKQITNCTTCHEGPVTYTIEGLYPVRYADFVGPVPADAYRGQAKCVGGGCETITDASYSPFLSVPAQLKSAQPIWSQCVLFVDGIWDPPVPLHQVASIAGVTTPDGDPRTPATSATAEPSSSIRNVFASSTSVTTSRRPTAEIPEPTYPSTAKSSTGPVSAHDTDQISTSDVVYPDVISTGTALEPQTTPAQTAGGSDLRGDQTVTSTQSEDDANPNQASAAPDNISTTEATNDPGGAVVSILAAAATTISPHDTPDTSSRDDSDDTDETQVQQVTSVHPSVTNEQQGATSESTQGGLQSTRQSESSASAFPDTTRIPDRQQASGALTGGAANPKMVLTGGDTSAMAALTATIGSDDVVAYQTGQSIVLEGDTSTIAVALGSGATFEGQSIRIASEGDGIAVGSSLSLRVPSAADSLAQVAVTAEGQTITALEAEHSVKLAAGGSTTIISQGAIATFLGQTISAGESVVVANNAQSVVYAAGEASSPTAQAIITTVDATFTAFRSDSSIILQDESSTTTLAAGAQVTFEGREISALDGASGVLMDRSSTLLLPAPAQVLPTASEAAVFTTDGRTFTAQESGNVIILQDASSTATISAGGVATFDSQIISLPASGAELVVSGIPIAASDSPKQSYMAVITTAEHTLTIVSLPGFSGLLLEDSSSTLTLGPTETATFEGQTISALSGGSGVVVNGASTALLTPTTGVAAALAVETVVTLASHGFTVLETSGGVFLEGMSSTISLADDSETVVAGETISVASSGDVVIIDASSTKTLVMSSAKPSSGSGSMASGGAGTAASTSTTTSDAADFASLGKWVVVLTSFCIALIVCFI